MERICKLLNDALTPYQALLGETDASGNRQLTVIDQQGDVTLRRSVSPHQLGTSACWLTVDGLHRDLQIAEGRLQPCVIAALQHQRAFSGTFA